MRTIRRVAHRVLLARGETMVETLVSILISSLALLMLATAIGSSVKVIMSSTRYMEAFYTDQSELVKSTCSYKDDTATVSFGVPLNKTDGESISVDLFKNDEDESIILYKRSAS